MHPAPPATLSQRIGAWAVGELDIPDDVRRVARVAALDVIGTTIAARRSEDFDIVAGFIAEGDAPGTLLGRSGSADPARSALINSYAGHLLDFDDSSGDVAGHPSTVVLPAALAVAGAVDASGSDLLDAYIIGVEVACKVGRIVNTAHYDHGWHPSATLGCLGAAAAASRLLGLTAEQAASALGLAAAFASGIKASFGTPAKPLQVARAAESGVMAAQLVHSGAYARADAFEHKQGFLRVFDDIDPSTIDAEDWWAGWSWLMPGIIIKQYPCCGSTHSAIESGRALARLDADDIASIRVALHPKRRGHVDRPDPSTPLEAKFSVQYVVARALISGAVTLDDFEAPRVDELRAMLSRVEVVDLPVEGERFSDRYAAEVVVTLADGSQRSERTPVALGREPGVMLAADRVLEKFHACVDGVIGRAQAAELATLVGAMEEHRDAVERLVLLSRPAR